MKWDKKWKIQSDTSGRMYTVSLADDNKTWGCSCPAWKFRRQECKHIKGVRKEYEEVELFVALLNDDEFITAEEFTL